MEKDDIDELAGVDHRITSSKNSDQIKPTIEGLSEREVRILVQDQFTPMTSRQGFHKNLPLESNIQAGSGLPTASTSLQEFHNSSGNLTTTEQLLRQKKIASASGDVFPTGKDQPGRNFYSLVFFSLDWAVGQKEGKHPTAIRSKSEPRHILGDLHDENLLSEQKREIVKKILMLQRQKFKDNQARKSRVSNEFENSAYNFSQLNPTSKNPDDQDVLLNE